MGLVGVVPFPEFFSTSLGGMFGDVGDSWVLGEGECSHCSLARGSKSAGKTLVVGVACCGYNCDDECSDGGGGGYVGLGVAG